MADTKLSALTQVTAPALTDNLYLDDMGVSKRIEIQDLSVDGAFTPTLEGDVTAGVQTYLAQSGQYARIGNIVIYQIYIHLSAKDAATNGSLIIKGLPFNAASASASAMSYVSGWALTAGRNIYGYIASGTGNIILSESDGSLEGAVQSSAISGNESLIVSGSYIAA